MRKIADMKVSIDFSKGERGKFFRPGAELKIPIYLDAANQSFVSKLAKKKKKDVSVIVNQLIHGDVELAKVLQ